MKRTFFSRLKTIPHPDPELTPENWCRVQPCRKIKIRSRQITLTQPSSAIFIYALGLLAVGAGIYFLRIRGSEASRLWWGISLLLWGAGALLAGTSYQAFGYHIKCAGRPVCAWTSWWEVFYLMLQQASMSALLAAVAYSCTGGIVRAVLLVYALVNAAVYVIIVFMGGIMPIRSFITFNLMVWVSTPILVISLVLNGYRYYLLGGPMDLVLVSSWVFLFVTMAAYFLYDHLDLTQKLWAKGEGIWFSQNDVLHIGLILWMIYIVTVVAGRIKDYSAPVFQG
jgi:hypothetical protein